MTGAITVRVTQCQSPSESRVTESGAGPPGPPPRATDTRRRPRRRATGSICKPGRETSANPAENIVHIVFKNVQYVQELERITVSLHDAKSHFDLTSGAFSSNVRYLKLKLK